MAPLTGMSLRSSLAKYLKLILNAKDLSIVFVILSMLMIIIVPLPSFVLDFFLAVSLAIATLIIFISVFIQKPTDFSTFPTLILFVTLFRLFLNIATTRMILSKGHEGPTVVSDIIASFGNFVVGGNFVIGIIIFIILVIINFIVITNGSTRVAEVQARFNLDAMPGKQMSIDADLQSGHIDEAEAQKRRAELIEESGFYGSMDGASKFVKGDAIAGILITLINIIGGILIGAFVHDMTIGDSAQTFTILTVGDGLVGQIPALLVSTATGIVITRSSKSEKNFANTAIDQLSENYKVLLIVGAIMLLFALIPGLPFASLFFIGATFIVSGLLVKNADGSVTNFLRDNFFKNSKLFNKFTKQSQQDTLIQEQARQDKQEEPEEEKSPEDLKEERQKEVDDSLRTEILEIDLSLPLIKLADKRINGDLLDRIHGIRKSIASQFGFEVPQVRIKDNLELQTEVNGGQYEIKIKNVPEGHGMVYPGQFLAMNTGLVIGDDLEGNKVKEPIYGIDAVWIEADAKDKASEQGYTIVDAATVITTHLSEIVKNRADELITKQDVFHLIERLKENYEKVVEALGAVNNHITVTQAVLKNLLKEGIPIKDMLTIAETISEVASTLVDPVQITEAVRNRLARLITNLYTNAEGKVQIMVIDQASEQFLLDRLVSHDSGDTLQLNAQELQMLATKISEAAAQAVQMTQGDVVLVVDPKLRLVLKDHCEMFSIKTKVLSQNDLVNTAQFEVLANIQLDMQS